ncbi:MAG: hypothetical protein GYB36_03965 [Alphaproteobacteria bacterium]|nr:hypothetical protein [Alphaproteobacteria bacterium]
MAKFAYSFRNLAKIVLLWTTLIAISASLYGALLAGQSAPRSLQFAEDAPQAHSDSVDMVAVAARPDPSD